MKHLFVSDVDNTLLSQEHPEFSLEFIETIKQLEESGSHFVLCSGRPTADLVGQAKGLLAKGVKLKYVAGYNGVEIYDLEHDRVIRDHSLTIEQVTEVCDYLDTKGYNYVIFDQDCIRTTAPDDYWTIRESELCGLPLVADVTRCRSQKVLLVVDPELNSQILADVKGQFPNYEVFDSFSCFVEVVNKGINKATALKEIAELENIEMSNTYGFGDSGNDFELIRQAGTGVAVSNAKPEVKEIADVIIGSCEEDSVGKFIKQIVENRQ